MFDHDKFWDDLWRNDNEDDGSNLWQDDNDYYLTNGFGVSVGDILRHDQLRLYNDDDNSTKSVMYGSVVYGKNKNGAKVFYKLGEPEKTFKQWGNEKYIKPFTDLYDQCDTALKEKILNDVMLEDTYSINGVDNEELNDKGYIFYRKGSYWDAIRVYMIAHINVDNMHIEDEDFIIDETEIKTMSGGLDSRDPSKKYEIIIADNARKLLYPIIKTITSTKFGGMTPKQLIQRATAIEAIYNEQSATAFLTKAIDKIYEELDFAEKHSQKSKVLSIQKFLINLDEENIFDVEIPTFVKEFDTDPGALNSKNEDEKEEKKDDFSGLQIYEEKSKFINMFNAILGAIDPKTSYIKTYRKPYRHSVMYGKTNVQELLEDMNDYIDTYIEIKLKSLNLDITKNLKANPDALKEKYKLEIDADMKKWANEAIKKFFSSSSINKQRLEILQNALEAFYDEYSNITKELQNSKTEKDFLQKLILNTKDMMDKYFSGKYGNFASEYIIGELKPLRKDINNINFIKNNIINLVGYSELMDEIIKPFKKKYKEYSNTNTIEIAYMNPQAYAQYLDGIFLKNLINSFNINKDNTVDIINKIIGRTDKIKSSFYEKIVEDITSELGLDKNTIGLDELEGIKDDEDDYKTAQTKKSHHVSRNNEITQDEIYLYEAVLPLFNDAFSEIRNNIENKLAKNHLEKYTNYQDAIYSGFGIGEKQRINFYKYDITRELNEYLKKDIGQVNQQTKKFYESYVVNYNKKYPKFFQDDFKDNEWIDFIELFKNGEIDRIKEEIAKIGRMYTRIKDLPKQLVQDIKKNVAKDYGKIFEYLKSGNLVVYDFETTGTDVNNDKVIQMAAMKIGISGNSVRVQYFSDENNGLRIKLEKNIGMSLGAQIVTGITDEKAHNEGVDESYAIAKFIEFIDGCILIGHNSTQFDRIILENLFKKNKKILKSNYGISKIKILDEFDTLMMARKILPEASSYKNTDLYEYLKQIDTNSKDVKLITGFYNGGSAHNASTDIKITADVLFAMLKKISDEYNKLFINVLNNNLSYIDNNIQNGDDMVQSMDIELLINKLDKTLNKILDRAESISGETSYRGNYEQNSGAQDSAKLDFYLGKTKHVTNFTSTLNKYPYNDFKVFGDKLQELVNLEKLSEKDLKDLATSMGSTMPELLKYIGMEQKSPKGVVSHAGSQYFAAVASGRVGKNEKKEYESLKSDFIEKEYALVKAKYGENEANRIRSLREKEFSAREGATQAYLGELKKSGFTIVGPEKKSQGIVGDQALENSKDVTMLLKAKDDSEVIKVLTTAGLIRGADDFNSKADSERDRLTKIAKQGIWGNLDWKFTNNVTTAHGAQALTYKALDADLQQRIRKEGIDSVYDEFVGRFGEKNTYTKTQLKMLRDAADINDAYINYIAHDTGSGIGTVDFSGANTKMLVDYATNQGYAERRALEEEVLRNKKEIVGLSAGYTNDQISAIKELKGTDWYYDTASQTEKDRIDKERAQKEQEYVKLLKDEYDLEKQLSDLRKQKITADEETADNIDKLIGLKDKQLQQVRQQTSSQQGDGDFYAEKYLENKINIAKLGGGKQGGKDSLVKGFSGGFFGRASSLLYAFTPAGFGAKAASEVVKSFQKVIQVTKELDKSLKNLRVVTGKSAEQADGLMISYNKMAKELGTTTAQVAQSGNEWLRQGYNIEETNKLIDSSTKLAQLGMMSESEAVKSLTSTMKGFKIEASSAMQIVDEFTKLDMEFATSAGEIANALARTASVAADAGMSMEEAAAAVTTIMDVTQLGSEISGTGLRSILSRYGQVKAGSFVNMESGEDIDQSINDIEKVLGVIGIQMRTSSSEIKDFTQVMDELADKWITLTQVEQSAIATAFAGTRQRNVFLSLLNNYDTTYKSALKSARSADGTANEKYKAYQDSIQYSEQRLAAAWEDFTQQVKQNNTLKAIADMSAVLVENLPALVGVLTTYLTSKSFGRIANITEAQIGDIKAKIDGGPLSPYQDDMLKKRLKRMQGINTVANSKVALIAGTSLAAGLSGLATGSSGSVASLLGMDISGVQQTTGDKLVTAAVSAAASLIPGVGAILGPIIGDAVGGIITYLNHRDEIERRRRVEEAQKTLEMINKASENIERAVSSAKLTTLTNKDLIEREEIVKGYKEALLDYDRETGATNTALASDFLRRLGESSGNPTIRAAEILDMWASGTTGTHNGVDIMQAYSSAAAYTKGQITYATKENEIYELGQDMYEAKYILARQYQQAKDDSTKEAIARQYEEKYNEKIVQAVSHLTSIQASLESIQEDLKKSNIESAFYSSGIGMKKQYELSSAALQTVIYEIAKELVNTSPDVFVGGKLSPIYREMITSFLRNQDNMSGLFDSSNLTYTEIYNNSRRISGIGKSYRELENIVSQEGWENSPAGREIISSLGGGSWQRVMDLIYNSDPSKMVTIAHGFGLALDAADKLGSAKNIITVSDALGSFDEWIKKLDDLQKIFVELTSSTKLSADNMQMIVRNYSSLLFDKNGNFSAKNLSGSLVNLLLSNDASSSVAGKFIQSANSDSAYWDLFKKIAPNFEQYLIGEAKTQSGEISTFNQAISLGGLDQNGMKIYSDMLKQVAGDIYNINEIRDRYIDLANNDMDNEISNLESIKDYLGQINKEREIELKLIKARQQLENARNEKKRVYREGIGFTYEADQSAVKQAKDNLDEIEKERQQQNVQYQIDMLNQQKEILNNVAKNEELYALRTSFEKFTENFGGTSDFAMAMAAMDKTFGAEGELYTKMYETIENANNKNAERIKNENDEETLKTLEQAAAEYDTAKSEYEYALKNGKSSVEIKNKQDALVKAQNAYTAAQAAAIGNKTGTADHQNRYDESSRTIDNTLSSSVPYNERTALKYGGETFAVATTSENIVDNATLTELKKEENNHPHAIGEVFEHNGTAFIKYGENDFRYATVYKQTDYLIDGWDTSGKLNKDYGFFTQKGKWTRQQAIMNGIAYNPKYVSGTEDEYNTAKRLYDIGVSPDHLSGLMGLGTEYDISQANDWYDKHPEMQEKIDKIRGFGFHYSKESSGTQSFHGGKALVNELGTEAIITPQGTLTSLPSKTGIIPADLTRSLWEFAEESPMLIKRLTGGDDITTNNNKNEDNSMNIENFYNNMDTPSNFNFDQFLGEVRAAVALTKNKQ